MINYSLFVKEKLKSIIADMASRKDEFVKDPGKDFTRRRKLSFEETINFMLSMGGVASITSYWSISVMIQK